MSEVPRLDRRDWSAVAAVLALLVVAYLVYPRPIVQYAAWLVIFTIWMAWFVYYGTKYYYSIEE
jgi:hypothetical protein